MKLSSFLLLFITASLASCAFTPEQKAAQEAKRIKAEQALQISLAKQCDQETADLMFQQFNPPLNQTEQQRQIVEQRYNEKINHPLFQACYKLAWQHYQAQQEIETLQRNHDHEFGLGFPRFCYLCW